VRAAKKKKYKQTKETKLKERKTRKTQRNSIQPNQTKSKHTSTNFFRASSCSSC
jgi:hypothetical protein